MPSSIEQEKRAAAEAGASLVHVGMRVGLGSGSTVARLLPILAVGAFEEVVYVASSPATERAARELGLAISPFDTLDRLDLALDGADQISHTGWLVKGGGRFGVLRPSRSDRRRQRWTDGLLADYLGSVGDPERIARLQLAPLSRELRCRLRQQLADTKRTHQKRHLRRLATHAPP